MQSADQQIATVDHSLALMLATSICASGAAMEAVDPGAAVLLVSHPDKPAHVRTSARIDRAQV